MRIRKFEELRKIHFEMKEKAIKSDSTDLQKNEEMLLESVKKVMELGWIARQEGLLALEDAVCDISVESKEHILKQLIVMLVDGTEPQVLEEIALSRYYAHLYTDYEALQYLIYLEGVLSIQANEGLKILEERLKVMLPENMYVRYSLELERVKLEEEQKKEKNLIENLCKGERLWNPNEHGYYVCKLLDYFICDVTDRELQRILRETENFTLSLAMKGMSGEARKHIFANLSKRVARRLRHSV